jgi:hypothetical protein
LLAEVIIASASNHDRVVHGQVAHGVTEARGRGISSDFHADEFAVDDLPVDSDWLEVSKLIADQLAVLSLASEIVKTFPHLIRLNQLQH